MWVCLPRASNLRPIREDVEEDWVVGDGVLNVIVVNGNTDVLEMMGGKNESEVRGVVSLWVEEA